MKCQSVNVLNYYLIKDDYYYGDIFDLIIIKDSLFFLLAGKYWLQIFRMGMNFIGKTRFLQ